MSDRLPEFHAALYGLRDGCMQFVPDSAPYLGVFQTLISVALFFLILLALRNRFLVR